MTVAEGTPQLDGYQKGARTRAAAKAAGMPIRYWVATRELGWHWARLVLNGEAAIHFVPPAGDTAECGRFMPRGGRERITTGIAERACGSCWRRVLGDTPRRSR